MLMKHFLKVCLLSLFVSIPLTSLQAEEIDVQETILKAQNNDKQGL